MSSSYVCIYIYITPKLAFALHFMGDVKAVDDRKAIRSGLLCILK